jgi:hypothetical protein
MKKHIMLAAALFAAVGVWQAPAAGAAPLATGLSSAATGESYVDKVKKNVIIIRPAPRRVFVVRPWSRRPHYGTLIGGIALGTLLAASVYYARPEPPAPDLCWYWANPSHTRGYWDYCD